MNDILKIKCPGCGTILQIKNQPDIEDKSVTCPTCKLKSKIGACERIDDQKDDDRTQYNHKQESSSEDTILGLDSVIAIGRLINTQTGSTHPLRLGRNTIGRKISDPLPTVTIAIEETKTQRTMSREHAIIEVTRLSNGSYRHFLYNWKGKNGTCVDGMPVAEGERVVLTHGQCITLGKVSLRFEIVNRPTGDREYFKRDYDT
ncbi:MAG: FHA domain-containing protein [Bacteroidaceae bacterium]|nr:FHA domain-containing protein [Bacteroidaceae bacterium]